MSSEASFMQLDLDLEQWRQDIQTFADTTQQELNEITDQLSATLAGTKSTGTGTVRPMPQAAVAAEVNSEESSDDRLSKLKQALAKRIK